MYIVLYIYTITDIRLDFFSLSSIRVYSKLVGLRFVMPQ